MVSLALAFLAINVSTSGYVGSRVCFGCHAQIFREFTKTDMGRSMMPTSDLDNRNVPREATVPAPSGSHVLRVFRAADGWHQSESEPNVFVDDHKLEYAVGSGANGLSFIVSRGRYLFQAPLSFYSKTGKWDLSPGYQYADLGFSRPIAEQCVLCHSGRARPVEGHEGEYQQPPFEELAIGCENCHGPGEDHVKRIGRGGGSIVNPAKLPARLAEDICMNCHQRGDTRIAQPGKSLRDFRPGQWLIDTVAILKVPPKPGDAAESDLLEHDSAMKLSRCFRASDGKLSCLTCHDPHVEPRGPQAAAYFRAKCFTCHSDQSCRLPKPARLAHNPPDDCAGCHMPKRNVAVISHSALTNHRIPARPGEPVPNAEIGDQTGLVLVDRPPHWAGSLPEITLLRAYGELAGRDPAFQQRYPEVRNHLSKTQPDNRYVQAALGHKALTEGQANEALDHLTKALPLNETVVYRDMAQALTKLGRAEDAIDYLKRAVEAEPYDPTTRKTLILEYINLKRYPDAREAMEEYVSLFPEDGFMRGLLARVSQ